MSARNFGVVLTMIVFILFYLPLSLYYVCKLYSVVFRYNAFSIHSAVFLRKRQTRLSFFVATAYMVQFIDLSIWAFVYTDFYRKDQLQTILISIASTLHIITQFVITACLTLRFWLITYLILVELMTQNHEWKRIINSNYQRDETVSIERSMYGIVNSMQTTIYSTQWILKHKTTFGSYRWCFKRLVIIFCFLLLLILFNEITNHWPQLLPSNLHFITTIFALIVYGTFAGLWGILLFLHCRSPQFSDSIFIRKELGYILQTMMFFLFIYIVFIIIFGLGISDSNVYNESYFTEIMVIFHVIAFSNMVMLYVIVFYPLQKAKQFSKIPESDELSFTQRSKSGRDVGRELSSPQRSVSTRSVAPKPKSDADRKLRLDDVLRNKYGFDAFIQHLSAEFSSENLLSMAEFLQFKSYVFKKSRHSVMNKDLRKWLMMLPLDALPRSEIVYAEEIGQNAGGKRKQKSTFSMLPKQRSISSRSGDDAVSSSSPPRSPSMVAAAVSPSDVDVVARSNSDMEREEHLPSTELPNANSEDDLHDNDDVQFVNEVKSKAHRLYLKYIKEGCEYEINISWELRSRYKATMDDLTTFLMNERMNDLEALRDVFDDACLVMKSLIGHSFTRFKGSKYYEAAKQELVGDHAKMNVIL